MIFLSPYLLSLIPVLMVIYYLIYHVFRKQNPIKFSGFLFISSAQSKKTKSIPLKAIFDLIPPLLVIFAMANPQIVKVSYTLVIDNSLSTGFLTEDGDIVFDKIKEKAISFINGQFSRIRIIPVCGQSVDFSDQQEAKQFIRDLSVKYCQDNLSSKEVYSVGKLFILSDKNIICNHCDFYRVTPSDLTNSAVSKIDFDGSNILVDIMCNKSIKDTLKIEYIDGTSEDLAVPCENSIRIEKSLRNIPKKVSLLDGGKNKYDDFVILNDFGSLNYDNSNFDFLKKAYSFDPTNYGLAILEYGDTILPNTIHYVKSDTNKEGNFFIFEPALKIFIEKEPLKVITGSEKELTFSNGITIGKVNDYDAIFFPNFNSVYLPFDLSLSVSDSSVKVFLLNLISWLYPSERFRGFYVDESFPSNYTVKINDTSDGFRGELSSVYAAFLYAGLIGAIIFIVLFNPWRGGF